jgi:DNA-directed RNA polymerase specialized sigma24 family protein
MAALSPRLRALVALRYVLELEPSEIAQVMRQPGRRVERQLDEARERLRDLLDGDDAAGSIEEIGDAW